MARKDVLTVVFTPSQVANLFKKTMEVVAEVCRVNESRFVDIGMEDDSSPVMIRFEIVPEDTDIEEIVTNV